MTTPNGMEPQFRHTLGAGDGTECAWVKDKAKRCSCGAVDYERQTGRSTKQMQNAPQKAAFIVRNHSYNYAYDLAGKIGRKDLRIRKQTTLEDPQSYYGVEWPAVIIDHAVVLTVPQREGLEKIRPLIGRRAADERKTQ